MSRGGGRHSPSIQSVVHVILTDRPDYPWATTLRKDVRESAIHTYIGRMPHEP
jgi:hypothetical protein